MPVQARLQGPGDDGQLPDRPLRRRDQLERPRGPRLHRLHDAGLLGRDGLRLQAPARRLSRSSPTSPSTRSVWPWSPASRPWPASTPWAWGFATSVVRDRAPGGCRRDGRCAVVAASPDAGRTPDDPPTPVPPAPPTQTPRCADMARLVIDPVTRTGGHLRIEADAAGGVVSEAWASATMFRGIETVLRGRDARDAWLLAERICGTCTTVHALASVRAVENALGIEIPTNARLIRNLLGGHAAGAGPRARVLPGAGPGLGGRAGPRSRPTRPPRPGSPARSGSWPTSGPDVLQDRPGPARRGDPVRPAGHLRERCVGPPGLPPDPGAEPPAAGPHARGPRLAADVHADPRPPRRQGPAPADLPRRRHGPRAAVGRPQPAGQPRAPAGPGPQRAARPQRGGHRDDRRGSSRRPWRSWSRSSCPTSGCSRAPTRTGAGSVSGPATTSRGATTRRRTARPPTCSCRAAASRSATSTRASRRRRRASPRRVTHAWYTYSNGDEALRPPAEGETVPAWSGLPLPLTTLEGAGKYTWIKAPRYDGKPMETGPLARMLVGAANGQSEIRLGLEAMLQRHRAGAGRPAQRPRPDAGTRRRGAAARPQGRQRGSRS